MLRKITLLVLVIGSLISAKTNYFYKVVDGDILKKGQLDMIGSVDYKTAKAPFEDELDDEFKDNYDGDYSKATTISTSFDFFYGLTDNLNLRFGIPVVSYNQIGWDPNAENEDGDVGMYVKKKKVGIGALTVGGKYNMNSVLKSLPPEIKTALYFDILIGMLGNDEISSGDVDYNFGVGFNYKNLVVNAGMRYNTGKFTKDAGQMTANANYALLSLEHQAKLGTKAMLDGDVDGLEGDDNEILPVQSMITYLNLGYVHSISPKVGMFGELDLAFPMRTEALVGIHIAPSSLKEMYLKPYAGMGLTKHSDQLVLGVDLVLREGIFSKEKGSERIDGYYYTSSPQEEEIQEVSAPIGKKPVQKQQNRVARKPAPKKVTPVVQAPKQKVDMYRIQISVNYTNIRALPKNTGTVITTAKQGEMFNMIADVGSYYNVEIPGGKSGFIHKSTGRLMKSTTVVNSQAQVQRNKDLEAQRKQMELNKQKQMIQQQKLAEQRRIQQEKQRAIDTKKRMEDAKKQEELRKIRLEKERKASNAKEEKKWRNYKATNTSKVNKASLKVGEGITSATYALAGALGDDDAKVRNAAFDALVSHGKVSVPAAAELLKSDRYFIKKQGVLVLKAIKDVSAVPYLAAGLSDKSITEECEAALKAIPSEESHAALMKHIKQEDMAKQIDDIKLRQENEDRVLLAKHSLTYGDTKNNILTMAQKIAGFKKNPSTEPSAIAIYNEQFLIFNKLMKKYDNGLGAGATLGLLEGYGYDKTIMTK